MDMDDVKDMISSAGGCLVKIVVSVCATVVALLLVGVVLRLVDGDGKGEGREPEIGASVAAADAAPVTCEEALGELDALVGLDSVKAEVRRNHSHQSVNLAGHGYRQDSRET